MARPIKEGLDYFPYDVRDGLQLQLIEAEYGLKGYAIYVKLLQRVYSNGYYMVFDKDVLLLFSRDVGEGCRYVSEIIKSLLRRGIFDVGMYNRHGILTSERIQQDYLAATSKRANAKIKDAYSLIKCTLNEVSAAETVVSDTEMSVSVAEISQRENKSKVYYSLSAAPTLGEVKQYCNERNSPVNPVRFYEYNNALGWTVKGQPVKDWKALLRNWEPLERKTAAPTPTQTPNTRTTKFVNYNQPTYTDEEIDEAIKRKKEKARKDK